MRIWLITVGEPLPVDGPGARLLRTGLVGEVLAQRGHDVTRWGSTFNHSLKCQRSDRDTCVELRPNYQVRLLHAPGYRRNISLQRVRNHRVLAGKFARLAPGEPVPDVILCSLPTIELCAAAVAYARARAVPIVIDVRDMWPDIFLELVPGWARPLARLGLAPWFRAARRALAGATAISGHAPAFVDWGLRYAGRERTAWDRDFPHGYSAAAPVPEAAAQAGRFWDDLGVRADAGRFVACFFGTFGRQFDLETVIGAARLLRSARPEFQFVLCGAGPALERYQSLAGGCGNVIFPGWVDGPAISALMRRASVGMAPYRSSPSFEVSYPNKPIEYFSAGLPVVSTLQGVLQQLLESEKCGVTCANGKPEELASALLALRDDPGRLAEMSGNGKALFGRRFAAEKVYVEMSDYLEEVAARGAGERRT